MQVCIIYKHKLDIFMVLGAGEGCATRGRGQGATGEWAHLINLNVIKDNKQSS